MNLFHFQLSLVEVGLGQPVKCVFRGRMVVAEEIQQIRAVLPTPHGQLRDVSVFQDFSLFRAVLESVCLDEPNVGGCGTREKDTALVEKQVTPKVQRPGAKQICP